MKEDVLEQLVEDYLQLNGYFTRHNVRFKPSVSDPTFSKAEHSVASDIDVMGFHPTKRGLDKVVVVSCKSYQSGFNASTILKAMQIGKKNSAGREVWRKHRELWKPIWAECFRAKVKELTGQSKFHYQIAITKLIGETREPDAASQLWASDETIKSNLAGSRFSFLDLQTIWDAVYSPKEGEESKAPASSEIGRLIQLMKAADIPKG